MSEKAAAGGRGLVDPRRGASWGSTASAVPWVCQPCHLSCHLPLQLWELPCFHPCPLCPGRAIARRQPWLWACELASSAASPQGLGALLGTWQAPEGPRPLGGVAFTEAQSPFLRGGGYACVAGGWLRCLRHELGVGIPHTTYNVRPGQAGGSVLIHQRRRLCEQYSEPARGTAGARYTATAEMTAGRPSLVHLQDGAERQLRVRGPTQLPLPGSSHHERQKGLSRHRRPTRTRRCHTQRSPDTRRASPSVQNAHRHIYRGRKQTAAAKG